MLRTDLKINQALLEKHKLLIIGCGNAHGHANKLHGSEEFYTVDYRYEQNPHLIGDIRDHCVQDYLKANNFDLICIEAVPALIDLSSKQNIEVLLNHLFKLLSANGTLIILNSLTILNDKHVHNTLFQFVDSFTMHQGKLLNSKDYNCTIVASKSTPTESVTNYINTALEIKYFSRINKTFSEIHSFELHKNLSPSDLPPVTLLESKGIFASGNQLETAALLQKEEKNKESRCCLLM